MAEVANDLILRFDALIAVQELKKGKKAYKRCRTKFFADELKKINEEVAAGNPSAKRLLAKYAKLIASRGSQHDITTFEKNAAKDMRAKKEKVKEPSDDLESRFHVLASSSNIGPDTDGYKKFLRKFLIKEHSKDADKFVIDADNVKQENKVFRFESWAIARGIRLDSPDYNRFYSNFFRGKGHKQVATIPTAKQNEELAAKLGALAISHDPDTPDTDQESEEGAEIKNLRRKLAAARQHKAAPTSLSQIKSPEERFQSLVVSLGLKDGTKKCKRHRREFFAFESTRDAVFSSGSRHAIENLKKFEENAKARGLQQGTPAFAAFKSQFDADNNGHEGGTSTDYSSSDADFSSFSEGSSYALQFKGRLHRSYGDSVQNDASDGDDLSDRQPKPQYSNHIEKARGEFNEYFGDATKIENWQRMCRDLKIDPVPASIRQCKKASKHSHSHLFYSPFYAY